MAIIMIMISTTIFQNIIEKLEKMTYFVFTILRVPKIAAQDVICQPQVRIGVIELQQIISKHKQAYIPTVF